MAIIVLNPSCQYGNVIIENMIEIYNEGLNLFEIAVETKSVLEKMGHVVYLTRESRNEASNLKDEMLKANAVNPDLMVSLHSDATGEPVDPTAGGTTTFYATEEGKILAESIHESLCHEIKKVYKEHQNRGVMTHWVKLYVLHNVCAPACLTEILFHTNPTERKLLLNKDFHRLVAIAVANGIESYLNINKVKA